MQIYNIFLVKIIGAAPQTYTFNKPATYIGDPRFIISQGFEYAEPPREDIVNFEEVPDVLEGLLDELLKQKTYPERTIAHLSTYYYPIDENKPVLGVINKIEKIKIPASVSLVPQPPRVTLQEYDLDGSYELIPINLTIVEKIDHIPIIAQVMREGSKMYAQLVPPPFGVTTAVFFEQVKNRIQNEVIHDLVEKYLDGLEVPKVQRFPSHGEDWVKKRVMYGDIYAEIQKVLIHEHTKTFTENCEE